MPSKDHGPHHWIPASYLAAWIDRTLERRLGQRIYLYSAEGEYLKWTHPKRIFKTADLYTRIGPDGEKDLSTEHNLAKLESDFARLRSLILEKRKDIKPEDRTLAATFVAAMRTRSPQEHDRMNQFWKQLVRVGDEMKREMQASSPEERRRLAGVRFPHRSGRSFSLETAREISEWPIGKTLPRNIAIEAPLLAHMKMTVLNVDPESLPLITSDAPVSWWAPPNAEGKLRSIVGLGHSDVQVTMPISPLQCLLFSHRETQPYADIGTDGAIDLNARTLAHCREVWVSNSPDLVVDWIERS